MTRLYPRTCKVVGDTLVVYDEEFGKRVCHVLEMKYLHESTELIGHDIFVSVFNCDQICVFNEDSRSDDAKDVKIILESAIKRAHEKAYPKKDRDRDGGDCRNVCCGQDEDGGEMANMALASQDAYELFLDGM